MKTRKSLPKSALARIYFIDRRIASGSYPNVRTLAEEYEAGTATICRDIEFMRYRLEAPIEFSRRNNGYYYTEKTYRLPARFASSQDMLALGMAKTLLSLYRNTPLYESARQLLDNITAPLTDEETDKSDGGKSENEPEPWYEKRIVAPFTASYPVAEEIWNAILAGLREDRVLSFEYQSTWQGEFGKRRVRPYQLLFDAGGWYLYAWAEEREGIRMFALSRIRNIALTTDKFSLPAHYDYSAHTGGTYFGIYAEETKEYFRIAVSGYYALWTRERLWAEDQNIEETSEGIIIGFTSNQYYKVLEWVLARGAWAIPLEPARLVKDWQWNIEKMKQNQAHSVNSRICKSSKGQKPPLSTEIAVK
jgi:predicted DNA-binding transcriptional regulator YafY